MEHRIERLEKSFGDMKEDVHDIKTDLAVMSSSWQTINDTLSELKNNMRTLTELQTNRATDEARITVLEGEIKKVKDEFVTYEGYAKEVGCPRLKVTEAEMRNMNTKIAENREKVDEIYPISSRLVKILDSAVTKIGVLAIVALLALVFGPDIMQGGK